MVTRGRLGSVGSPSDDDKRTTQSSMSSSDHDRQRTVVINRDQELTWRHVQGSESSDLHRDVLDRGVLDRAITIVHSPEAPSDGWEDSWKKSTIVVRSNCDRGAIEPRSWLLHCGINATILLIHGARFPLKMASEKVHDRSPIATRSCPRSKPDRHAIVSTIEARSPRDRVHDRSPIATRSWPQSSAIVASFDAKSMLIHRGIKATINAKGIRSHDAFSPLLRPHQSATIFRLNFPLKACILPSCSLTFDRFVKVIKRISRKVLSSYDPLLPRM